MDVHYQHLVWANGPLVNNSNICYPFLYKKWNVSLNVGPMKITFTEVFQSQ